MPAYALLDIWAPEFFMHAALERCCLTSRTPRAACSLTRRAPEILKCPTKKTPDQFKQTPGGQHYEMGADAWAVGTFAYELVVGTPPFKAAGGEVRRACLLAALQRALALCA